MALWDAERLRVSCCCVLMCGMDATDNGIGDAKLGGESVCLATCGAGLRV